eukprot:sb/3465434/
MSGSNLLSTAIRKLLSRVQLDKGDINHVIVGNVFHEADSPNMAASACIKAGLTVPCHSISMACISGQAALAKGVEMINNGHSDVVLVGGVEYLSDLPIRVNERMRKTLLKVRRTDNRREKLALLAKIKPRDLNPDVLKVVEFQTQETFVANGDKISRRFGITRSEQDEYGYRSHTLSSSASRGGKFNFICPVHNPATDMNITSDSTLREWSQKGMSELRSVLRGGTVTIATANQPCDGAAVCLLASETAAERFNLNPRARVGPACFAACSPVNDLLLGTTHSLHRLKSSQGVDLSSVDVWEIYEGFAGEILSQFKALRSSEFAGNFLNSDSPVVEIDTTRVNKWGGTIGLGHPFGATGLRLLLHTVGRMEDEEGRLGVVSGCAGGGLGAAFAVHKL